MAHYQVLGSLLHGQQLSILLLFYLKRVFISFDSYRFCAGTETKYGNTGSFRYPPVYVLSSFVLTLLLIVIPRQTFYQAGAVCGWIIRPYDPIPDYSQMRITINSLATQDGHDYLKVYHRFNYHCT